MKLTLGPLLFNWSPRRGAISMPASPTRRRSTAWWSARSSAPSARRSIDDHIPAVIERLAAGGKKVVLGSLMLMSLTRERNAMAELAADDSFTMEVNDLSCLGMIGAGRTRSAR